MTTEKRDIQRKLRVLQHAEKIGRARKACRYFGVGRSSFYRLRDAYQKHGEAGLKNAKSIPKNPANQTPAEIVEKVCICGANITSGQSGSSGIWRVTTALKSQIHGFTASLSATVLTGCPKARGCVNYAPNAIRNKFRVITFKWMLSF
jgi:hypothetical protein